MARDDETCPVCKTNRYFNKDMEFLINPECYHLMCRTCVERIFKDGPNQCPYATCHKTLRLRGFKSAFFNDLAVERDVDIRRRVAQVFNKVEDDFESLADYNDYLDKVECLTADLVSGTPEDKTRAEAQLLDWEAQHKAEIERNKKIARESDETRQRRRAAEQDEARLRRQQEMQDEADERASAARFREEMLDSLASAEAGRGAEAMDKVLLRKKTRATGLSIRGLKDKTVRVADDNAPYDPFGGLLLAPTRVDTAEDSLAAYHSEWLDITRTKNDYVVGGYSTDEYISRALYEAFSGLGVFVAEDKMDTAVATAGAAEAATA